MRRRHFLRMVGLSLPVCGWVWSDPFDFDFAWEWQGLLCESRLGDGRRLYQQWSLGQLTSATTLARLKEVEARLETSLKASLALAPRSLSTWLTPWSQGHRVELAFLQSQVASGQARRQSAEELQARWMASLHSQQLWQEARRVRLPLLLKRSKQLKLQQFFQWTASILALMEAELELARDLARGILTRKGSVMQSVRSALALCQRGASIRVPGFLQSSHQVFQDRQVAMARLSESAEAYWRDPGPDSVANLREDEARYGELVLKFEESRLKTLRSLLP